MSKRIKVSGEILDFFFAYLQKEKPVNKSLLKSTVRLAKTHSEIFL